MPLLPEHHVPYLGIAIALGLACALFVHYTEHARRETTTPAFKAFRRTFLTVYLLATAADWLNGPFIYKLYASYGFSKGDIGKLFIAGYGSSAVFGTVAAGLADKYGRARLAKLYCLFYGVSCATKHFNSFGVLLFGRLVGGVSTSILHSAFESWMVHKHRRAAYPDEWLAETFSVMTFANGIVAIAAGVVANFAAAHVGYTAPFDLALTLLVACGAFLIASWDENYGKAGGGAAATPAGMGGAGKESSFRTAWRLLRTNRKVMWLGCLQACFESAMFIFVFMWTPILEFSAYFKDGWKHAEPEHVPHGLVFASFMVCLMIGSYVFKALARHGSNDTRWLAVVNNREHLDDYPFWSFGGLWSELRYVRAWVAELACPGRGSLEVDTLLVRVFYVAVPALLAPVLWPDRHWLGLFTFCVFEVCCGAYFPACGTLRGRHIPSEVRSTMISLFRVPVNLLVVLALIYVGELSNLTVMWYCAALLMGGAVAARRLRTQRTREGGAGEKHEGGNSAAVAALKKMYGKDAPILSGAAADQELQRVAAATTTVTTRAEAREGVKDG